MYIQYILYYKLYSIIYTVHVHAVFFVLGLIVYTVEFVIVFGEAQVIQFALLALIISSRLSKPEHGRMDGQSTVWLWRGRRALS